ncbi:MAG: autotransporter outer membrane beta-barrel domain-containing protein, partial [Verrucomicrobiota bacterium]
AAIGGTLGYVDSYDSVITPGTVHSVTMTLKRVPYQVLGGGGMRSRLGAVLDRNLASTDPSLSGMLDTLDALYTQAQVQSVLDRLNPSVYPEVLSLSMSRLQDVQKAVSDRMLILGGASASGPSPINSSGSAPENQWTAWTSGYGSAGSQSARDPSEAGINWNTYGNVTAVEKAMGPVTIGFLGALGSSNTQMSQADSKISADSWHLGSYASLPVGARGFLNVAALYGQAENKIQRLLPYASTGTGARGTSFSEDWLLQVGGGVELAPKETDWSAVLSADFAYGGVKMGAIHETGIGDLGVESAGETHVSPLSRLGFALAKEWRIGSVRVRPEASVFWIHNFDTEIKPLEMHLIGDSGTAWSVSSRQRSPDSLRAAASVEFGLGGRRSTRIYGEEELQQGINVFRGGVTFTVGF